MTQASPTTTGKATETKRPTRRPRARRNNIDVYLTAFGFRAGLLFGRLMNWRTTREDEGRKSLRPATIETPSLDHEV